MSPELYTLRPLSLPCLQRVLCAFGVVLGAACSEPAQPPADAGDDDATTEAVDAAPAPELREVALVDHKGWQNYPAELDPLSDHQPETLRCTIAGWRIEYGELDVDTTHCNYLLIEHPVAVDVPAGSEIEIQLGHFDLLAPEPATGHVALLFGADPQWETFVDIPSSAAIERMRFHANRDVSAGEMLRLHLHNHGQNTWLIGPILAWVP